MSIEVQIRDFVNQCLLYSDESIQYSDDDSFLQQHLIDSTTVMEVVLFVEETYHIAIHDSEIIPDNFDSISRIAQYVRSKMANGQTPHDGMS